MRPARQQGRPARARVGAAARLLAAAVLSLGGASAQASEQDERAPAARRPFARLIEDARGGRLELLVATYEKADAELTLFGCVHVADRAFYLDMQRRFRGLDALLYELIADPNVRPYPGMEVGDDEHWISLLQGGMGAGLKLTGQFDAMDYRMDNFVHADMTEAEWEAALEAAGRSELGELLSGGPTDVDREAEAKKPEIDLVGAFRSGGGVAELRIVAARMLMTEELETGRPNVIIHGRNEKCLRVLDRELQAGKKRLGIFYGSAHMEHMERRLVEELGWRRVREQWVLAWDCSYASWPKQERGLKRKRYRARRDLAALLAAAQELATAGDEPVTWDALRAARADGRLPGRADGVDPWGRRYLLREVDGGYQVRCCGSDGVADTEDDLCVGAGADNARPRRQKN